MAFYPRAICTGSAARSATPRRRTAGRASSAGSRSPGLALLRLVQGRIADAHATIRRVLGESRDPVSRARMLPAYVEIALAAGDVPRPGRAAGELAQIADGFRRSAAARGWPPRADGHVLLVEDDPAAALTRLRRAWPHLAGDRRAVRGRACPRPHRARLPAAGRPGQRGDGTRRGALDVPATGRGARIWSAWSACATGGGRCAGGLIAREVEVLRLVAAGKTNRAIAERPVPQREDGGPAHRATSSSSSTCRPGRRPPRTRTSTTWSEPRT